MAYLAVDENGDEYIFQSEPKRYMKDGDWIPNYEYDRDYVLVPNGTIEKILNYKITWIDNPVEIT